MARLNGAQQQLMRIKSGLTADDDYTDPTVPIPGFAGQTGTLLAPAAADGTFDPNEALAWAINPRRADGSPLTKVKIKVTLRTEATGVEVAGTWSAIVFSVVPRDQREGKGSSRPGVEWLGAVTDQPTMKPAILDVAASEMMGLSFTSITGGGADQVFVYVQEWA